MSMAPGNVNLVGEHTDYYEDFVPIPMVFPMVTVMVARARHDDSGMRCVLQVLADVSLQNARE